MKNIMSIEMANDNDIHQVSLGDEITILKSEDGYFEVHDSDIACDNARSYHEAKRWAKEYAVNDGYIIVSGYGKRSGRKFWQLPERMQNKILKMAGF